MSQPEKTRRGCMARIVRAIGVLILLVIGLVIIVQCSTRPTRPTRPAGPAQAPPAFTATPAQPDASTAAPTDKPPPADTPLPAPPPTDTPIPAPTDTPPPADPNRGITFGEPVIFDSGGFQTVAALVANTTAQVKSFTVKATYKTGDQILATASGAVNDLLPGQTRAVSMLTMDAIPASYDSVRIDVDTMIREVDTAASADAAMKITFGPPAISGGDFPTVNVEVTNNDGVPHSMIVQAVFVQGGQLVGVASGAVNELAAGQTKTATLLGQGEFVGDVTVAVETLVQ